MFKIFLSFSLLFTSFGFLEDYIDIIYQRPGIDNAAFDKTIKSFQLPKNGDSISAKILMNQLSGTELKQIRILKTRSHSENLQIIVENKLQGNISIFIQYKSGWNEIDFPGNITVSSIQIVLNQTTNNDTLEISEMQILFKYKLFSSCLEWYNNIDYTNDDIVRFFDPSSSYIDNVARVESGATCISSSGICRNSIKDSVMYLDELWIPDSSDRKPFLKIKFFQKYLIEEIRINQPNENSTEDIFLKSQQNLIIIQLNKTSNWTKIQTNLQTKWIQFSTELNINQSFYGFYEVEAYARKPKTFERKCLNSSKFVQSNFQTKNSHKFTPQSNNECSESYQLFSSNEDDRLFYLKTWMLNSVSCSENLFFGCANSLHADNIVGKFYYQNNRTQTILIENSSCTKRSNCSCINRNINIQGTSNVDTKYLPIKKICANKRDLAKGNPSLEFGSVTFFCQSHPIYLSSSNSELTDTNLQTCTSKIVGNTISIKHPVNSSMEVFVFFKNIPNGIDCKITSVFARDDENCNEKMYRKCQMMEGKNYKSIPMKICSYICSIGLIDELKVMQNYEYSLVNAEICEISTNLLDTVYNG